MRNTERQRTSSHVAATGLPPAVCKAIPVYQEMRAGTSRLEIHINMVVQMRHIQTPLAHTSAAGIQVGVTNRCVGGFASTNAHKDKSPWTALEYCDADGVDDTWTCHSPESCGCSWNQGSWDMLELPFRGCAAMGSDARAALYAPASLAPWVSLPKNPGGSTGYFPTTTLGGKLTWSTTAIKGCKC